jgi:hypothetical protein
MLVYGWDKKNKIKLRFQIKCDQTACIKPFINGLKFIMLSERSPKINLAITDNTNVNTQAKKIKATSMAAFFKLFK